MHSYTERMQTGVCKATYIPSMLESLNNLFTSKREIEQSEKVSHWDSVSSLLEEASASDSSSECRMVFFNGAFLYFHHM